MKIKLEKEILNLENLYIEDSEIILFGKFQKTMNLIYKDGIFSFKVIYVNGFKDFKITETKEAQEYYDKLYVVPVEITNDLQKFKRFILDCEIGISYTINFKYYYSFCISKEDNDGFTWVLWSKDIWRRITRPRTKEKGRENYAKQFETIELAKNDFIKHIKTYFRK